MNPISRLSAAAGLAASTFFLAAQPVNHNAEVALTARSPIITPRVKSEACHALNTDVYLSAKSAESNNNMFSNSLILGRTLCIAEPL